MAIEILMPELGESVHEGTISRWLKKVGEFVQEDEPVVEIMTDKVNTELPAPVSGILTKILIQEGENVHVFHAMGVIEEQEGGDHGGARAPEGLGEHEPEPMGADELDDRRKRAESERRWYTPLVRSMAKEHGISDSELAAIDGTGEGGRVTKRDVEALLASRSTPKAPTPTPVATASPQAGTSLTGMRKMIADHMVRSSAVPTVTTVTACDVTSMVKFRDLNKDAFLTTHGVKLTYTPFFVKAVTEALLEFPLVNSALVGEYEVVRNATVNVGVAVALGPKGEDGLIVPVIRDCQSKSLIEIAGDLEAITKAARANSLKPADVQGGTFTVTNPGTYGALFGTPMINAPQAGILGTYAISKEPVVIDDMIAIRSIMHLVLTYDHRIIDGMVAGKFLASVRDRLQKFDFFK